MTPFFLSHVTRNKIALIAIAPQPDRKKYENIRYYSEFIPRIYLNSLLPIDCQKSMNSPQIPVLLRVCREVSLLPLHKFVRYILLECQY